MMWIHIVLWLVLYMCQPVNGQLHKDCFVVSNDRYGEINESVLFKDAEESCRDQHSTDYSVNNIEYTTNGDGFGRYRAVCCLNNTQSQVNNDLSLDNCQFFDGHWVDECYDYYGKLFEGYSGCSQYNRPISCCTRDVGTWQFYVPGYIGLNVSTIEYIELCQFYEEHLDCDGIESFHTVHCTQDYSILYFMSRIQRMDLAYFNTTCETEMPRASVSITFAFQSATNTVIWDDYPSKLFATINDCSCQISLNNRTCKIHVRANSDEMYFGENIFPCVKCNCTSSQYCHPITGSCVCKMGYTGINCTMKACSYMTEKYYFETYIWHTTSIGLNATANCVAGYLHRECRMNQTWGNIVSKGCQGVKKVLDKLLVDGDIDNITSLLTQYAVKSYKDEELADVWLSTASSVLNKDDSVFNKPLANNNKKFLALLENFTSNVEIPSGKESISLVYENINVVVKNVNRKESSKTPLDIETQFNDNNTCLDCTINGPSLTINTALLNDYFSHFRLSIIVYRTAKLFYDSTNTNKSKYHVVSVTINDTPTKSTQPILTYIIPREVNDTHNITCVYWDKVNNKWIENDINTTVDKQNRTVCESPHLSIFSMLILYTDDRHAIPLTWITNIGCGLSLVGLGITIIIYSMFPILRSRGTGQILLCLCISMFLLNLVFLAAADQGDKDVGDDKDGSDKDGGDKDGDKYRKWQCTAAAITIHYFLLTTLTWMTLEAIIMYQKLVVVFQRAESHYLLKCSLIGWGIPALVITITALASIDAYQLYPAKDRYCLLSVYYPGAFYGSIFTPTCLMLIVNIYVFVRVVIIILRKAKKYDNTRQGVFNYISIRQIQGSFSVMVALGITWVFGPMMVFGATVTFEYLFTICNSIQGFLIFLFQCVLHKEVQRAVCHFYRTGRRKQVTGSIDLKRRQNKTSKSTDETSM